MGLYCKYVRARHMSARGIPNALNACVIPVRQNLCYSWHHLCYYSSDSEYFLHRGSLGCHQTGNLTSTSLSVRSSVSISLALILSFHLSPCVCLSFWLFFSFSSCFANKIANDQWRPRAGHVHMHTSDLSSLTGSWLGMRRLLLFSLRLLVHTHLY